MTKQTAENTQNPKRSKKHTRNNIQICTTIDPDDLTVIKKKGISVAELLRRAVNELILGNDEGYIPTKKSVPGLVPMVTMTPKIHRTSFLYLRDCVFEIVLLSCRLTAAMEAKTR